MPEYHRNLKLGCFWLNPGIVSASVTQIFFRKCKILVIYVLVLCLCCHQHHLACVWGFIALEWCASHIFVVRWYFHIPEWGCFVFYPVVCSSHEYCFNETLQLNVWELGNRCDWPHCNYTPPVLLHPVGIWKPFTMCGVGVFICMLATKWNSSMRLYLEHTYSHIFGKPGHSFLMLQNVKDVLLVMFN